MKKLYYENVYQKHFQTNVVAVLEKDKHFHVELDETAFYPGGGGQPCDIGFIDNLPVTEVYEQDGHLYHIMERPPLKKKNVKCSIDWKRRFDYMQHHLGQHLLSAVYRDLFHANTVSFHLGTDICTIDIDRILSEEELRKGEEQANACIFERLPVEVLYPSKAELRKLKLTKDIIKQYDTVRIVKIDDLDINPCGGTHPENTSEVGMIKILKWEKYKNHLRITFICGQRAVTHSLLSDNYMQKICRNLTCNEEGALTKIKNLTDDFRQLQQENQRLQSQVGDYEVQEMLRESESIGHLRIINKIFENKEMKYLNVLANKFTSHENVIVLFGLKQDNRTNLLFASSANITSIKMNTLLQETITLLDGKGGGTPHNAQGGGKHPQNLENTLLYALNRISQSN